MIKKKKKDPRITPFVGSVTLLTAIFTLLGWYFSYSPYSPFTTIGGKIGIHLVLCIPLLLAVYFLITRKVDPRFLILFALFFIVLGPAGAVTIFVSLVLFLIYIKITQPISDLLASLFPAIIKNRGTALYERILYRLDDFQPDRVPIPFKDIMAFGSYTQKRMAIEKMLRYYRPEFAPALKMGLQDKSSAVKVQAATAISYIDHKMFDENLRLKKIHEDDPEDPEAWQNYIVHTSAYIESDILDPDRKMKMVKHGISSIEGYLKEDPENKTVLRELAWLLRLDGKGEEEQKVLEQLLEKAISPEDVQALLSNLYFQKKYEVLHSFAAKIKATYKELANYPDLETSINLWASARAAQYGDSL
jgi:hypothetical protein